MDKVELRLWDATTGTLKWKRKERPLGDRRKLRLPDANVLSLAFHPNGKCLVTSSYRVSYDGMDREDLADLEVWDPDTGQLTRTVASQAGIHSPLVAISPGGKLLWGSEDQGKRGLAVRAWTLRD